MIIHYIIIIIKQNRNTENVYENEEIADIADSNYDGKSHQFLRFFHSEFEFYLPPFYFFSHILYLKDTG